MVPLLQQSFDTFIHAAGYDAPSVKESYFSVLTRISNILPKSELAIPKFSVLIDTPDQYANMNVNKINKSQLLNGVNCVYVRPWEPELSYFIAAKRGLTK
jgi:hypothetical protein